MIHDIGKTSASQRSGRGAILARPFRTRRRIGNVFKMSQTVGGFMKNKLALCSRGQLGLITHDKRQPVTYADHSVGMEYVGIHLTDGPGRKAGDPWSARNPVIVGELCSSPAVMP